MKISGRSLFLLAVSLFVCTQSCLADGTNYVLGDDDGFGAGSPVVAGDEISTWGPADGDGTDELIAGRPTDLRDFVFTFDPYVSVTSATLFAQYIDWPESWAGYVRIDGVDTPIQFPQLVPWDQEAPWTVLNITLDLTAYSEYMTDGKVVFNLVGGYDDAIIVDYMTLTIDGSHVPAPGAALLGILGAGCVRMFRRRIQ
ncbi:MAG: hypothetical protein ACM3VT_09610 [Solirubrobacterales bacterium]